MRAVAVLRGPSRLQSVRCRLQRWHRIRRSTEGLGCLTMNRNQTRTVELLGVFDHQVVVFGVQLNAIDFSLAGNVWLR